MNSPSNTTASSTQDAVVSLGSNLSFRGRSPVELVHSAMDCLRRISVEAWASSLYRSEPLDCPPGSDDFINAVMVLQLPPAISAHDLLAETQGVEQEFGRQRGAQRNQARTLDIDIISYKDQLLESNDLILPHPRAVEREFVLLPLSEIDPGLVLPGQAANVTQLLQRLPEPQRVFRLA